MTDEDRAYMLAGLERCPICHWFPVLRRSLGKFSVQCQNPDCAQSYNTPWMEYSHLVTRIWRLAVTLATK